MNRTHFFAEQISCEMNFKSNFLINAIVIAAFSLFLAGCEFKDIQIVKADGIKVQSTTSSELSGVINITLMNPNSFPITVKSGEFEVFLGNTKVGVAKLTKSFKISSNSTETYPVEVNGNFGNALAGSISGLLGLVSGKNPKVQLKGEIKARSYLVSRTIPVELETEIPLKGLF